MSAASSRARIGAGLARTARKKLAIRAGLRAAAEVERELGGFTEEELADAEKWAKRAIKSSQRSGSRAQ